MSRDFGIFMPKHLAVQWLLNSYKKLQITGKTVICRKKISLSGKNHERFSVFMHKCGAIFFAPDSLVKDLKSPHFLKKTAAASSDNREDASAAL